MWANLLPTYMLPYDKDRLERKKNNFWRNPSFPRHNVDKSLSCRLTIHKNFLRIEYPQVHTSVHSVHTLLLIWPHKKATLGIS